MVTVVLSVLAALTNSGASVLQRLANKAEAEHGESGARGVVVLLRRPVWLGGFGAVIVSFGFQAGALDHGDVSLVQTLLLLELPLTLAIASRIFGRRLGPRDWMAILTMTAGVALMLVCLSPTGGDPGGVDGATWGLGAGSVLVVIAALVALAARSGGAERPVLLGIATGVCFALTAVFISAALAGGLSGIFGRWQTYALAVTGLAAIVCLQEALRQGSLLLVQPGVTLSDPATSILLGVLLFGEDARGGGWLLGDLVAAGALAWGTWTLSHSSLLAETVTGADGGPEMGATQDSLVHPADRRS